MAYSAPIVNIQNVWTTPPKIAEVLRPHLSAKRKAGMVMSKMRSAEIPEARNDAVEEERPADAKSRGA